MFSCVSYSPLPNGASSHVRRGIAYIWVVLKIYNSYRGRRCELVSFVDVISDDLSLSSQSDALILTHYITLMARIAIADQQMFLTLMAATATLRNTEETVLWEGLLDQWWRRVSVQNWLQCSRTLNDHVSSIICMSPAHASFPQWVSRHWFPLGGVKS